MYRALVPVSDVEDIPTAAYDLHQALTKHNNLDIEAEFPSTLEQYATAASAEQNLNRLAQSHNPGVWELFLVFAGGQAIGQSIVTISQHPPRAVDPASPNVSGWIARPFRQKGHGQFSLEERLKVVTERFWRQSLDASK